MGQSPGARSCDLGTLPGHNYYGDQTLNVLKVELSSGYDLQPYDHPGCSDVADQHDGLGAFAGVNGGFFASCAPTDLLRADDVTSSTTTTGYEQRAVGWDASASSLTFEWVATATDWTTYSNAMAGYPSLVCEFGGGGYPEHPGVVAGGVSTPVRPWAIRVWLILMTPMVHSVGRRFYDAKPADAMVMVGAQEALNLDGGGSTTMVIDDCWLNDTVNFPSDNGAADHDGARAVASGLYIR